MTSRPVHKDLDNISNHRLFVGSGVEKIVDSALPTRLDEFGQYHADYSDITNDAVSRVIYNADGSRNEDQIAEALFSKVAHVQYDNTVGYYSGLYVGYATRDGYRERGSSGGLVSWLSEKLLSSGKIDALVHVKKSSQPGLLFEYGISKTIDEFRSGTKSRYYPAELSSVLAEIKEKPGRYALVGIPEIISEVRLLAEIDNDIKERVSYFIGLVAGHQKTTKYAEAIAWEYGIKPGDLTDIDFRIKRESGWASHYDTKFTGLIDGEERTFVVRATQPFVSSWAHGFFKARFSDFTDNTFNEVADVTFGDAWLREYIEDSAGNNILIVRHPEIAEIINQGIITGEIALDAVPVETIIRSQKGLVHHTKDELGYRLYKEAQRNGWAPKKRVQASDTLDDHRKQVQDARQDIAEKSHIYYREAVKRGDFDFFKKKMTPFVSRYNRLYGETPQETKNVKADGAILTLPGYYNYGNVIQRYALQKFLKKNGFDFVSYIHSKVKNQGTIYHHPRSVYVKAPLRFLKRLARGQRPYWFFPSLSDRHKEIKQEINLVNFVNKYVKVKNFDPSDQYDTYVVGSDQVWRKWRNDSEMLAYYFLDFLKGRKANRIAYAASFGKDNVDEVMSKDDVVAVKPFLQFFNAIGVREKSAIPLIENTWGIDTAVEVVDPTLLLDRSDYSRLIDASEVRNQVISPIFGYVLDETDRTAAFMERAAKFYGKELTKIGAHGLGKDEVLPPVELWLKGYRDAEVVVTNSFHGMMFSIINNTDFIIVGRKDGGLSRIQDFMDQYGIEGRLVDEEKLEVFDFSQIPPLNWEAINDKLHVRRQESAAWLLRAIRENKL